MAGKNTTHWPDSAAISAATMIEGIPNTSIGIDTDSKFDLIISYL
jgi:hypothetical protein